MSGFKAENIESDEELDDEIDDTREIQIEDALKLYQNALKLHAQGPQYLDEASDAYAELFNSEVFKYPESLGEFAREEKLGVRFVDGELAVKDAAKSAAELDAVAALPPVAGVGEDASSTLPNLLYLSYKNRALFKLEQIRQEVKLTGGVLSVDTRKVAVAQVASVLQDLGEALDKDEGDADTWRHAARVCRSMGSTRLSRFCLEAALEDDGEGTDQIVGLRSLEAEIIGNDLRKLEEDLEDDIAAAPLKESFGGERALPADVLKAMGLHTYLPEYHALDTKPDVEAGRHVITLQESSWAAIGEALVEMVQNPQKIKPGMAVGLEAPQIMNIEVEEINAREGPTAKEEPEAQENQVGKTNEDTDMQDAAANQPDAGERKGSLSDNVKQEEALVSPNEDSTTHDSEQNKGLEPVTRKRSSAEADLPETADGGRARSKRIRARGSLIAESMLAEAQETENPQEEKLEELKKADVWLFEVMDGILRKLDVDTFSRGEKIRTAITGDTPCDNDGQSLQKPMRDVLRTFYKALQSWSEDKTKLLTQTATKNASTDTVSGGGLSAFLESSKGPNQQAAATNILQGSSEFIEFINADRLTVEQTALRWLFDLIFANAVGEVDKRETRYLHDVWSETLKRNAIQLLIAVDEVLFEALVSIVDSQRGILDQNGETIPLDAPQFERIAEMTQAVFELHLDEYSRIADRASDTKKVDKRPQYERMDKWARLSREALRFGVQQLKEGPTKDTLTIRHVWATVLHMEASEQTPRPHILECFEDLKKQFLEGDALDAIYLPNCAVMAELSAQVVDREISRLETMDFFLNVFTKENDSPVELIERLEPILLPSSSFPEDVDQATDETNGNVEKNSEPHARRGSNFAVLSKFLMKASASLRLSLWRKLLEAYRSIDYKPKVFSIQLKMLELIMEELQNTHEEQADDERESMVLSWLNELSRLVTSTFELSRDVPNALECIDMDHVRSSSKVLAQVYLVLYPVSLYDDHNMLTSKAAPSVNPFRKYTREALHKPMKVLHDLQMKVAVLLDRIFSEAVAQLPEKFQGPHFDSGLDYRLQYLRHVHYAFGLRRLCKISDSLFLKYQKSVLQSLPSLEKNTSDDLCQILLDLYDLNCFSSQQDKQDHGCDSDYLNYSSALEILDFVLDKARKANIRDLLKSEMSKATDKLNTALGLVKPGQATQRNRKICQKFFNSPLNPLSIYRALRGVGELPTAYIRPEDAIVAAKGWNFLQGQLAMGKYRAARLKNAPGDMDDLKTALDYLSQDLEFSTDRWETWYNLAQTNDALIEEEVLWTAEKLNTSRGDLIQGQRASIHAYEMALATALRTATSSVEVMDRMADLCSDFGLRIYSSSREPFSMQPFSLSDFTPRSFSSTEAGGGLYQRRQFHSMKAFDAWKLAAVLFEQAILQRPKRWINHYLRGKCLWKMSRRPDRLRYRKHKSPTECTVAAIQSFERAVDLLPKRKDPSRGEPTLEPIYKIVALMHKLVSTPETETRMEESLAEEKITNMLNKQNQFEVPRIPKREDFESWADYVLDVLKIIRAADKAHWHHRLVFRAANIMYSKHNRDTNGAKIVKEYLQEQKVYSSKTLALSVWKPDNERAGRHWIYMTKYARFLAEILEKTDDIEAIQLLAKRVRKKNTDFYDHAKLWEEVSLRHLRMHRKYGNIKEHCDEDVFRNMQQDEFVVKAARIDEWAQSPYTNHPLRDILAEVAEVKKLNAGLARSNPFDDLLTETFATIWDQIMPTFDPPVAWPPPDRQNGQKPADVSRAATPVPETSPRRNVMSLTNLINSEGGDDNKPVTAPGALHFIQQNPPSRPSSVAPTEPGVPIKRSRLISRREYLKRANEATWTKNKENTGPGRGRRGSIDKEGSSSGMMKLDGEDGSKTDNKPRVIVNGGIQSATGKEADSEAGAAQRRKSSARVLEKMDSHERNTSNAPKSDAAIIDDSDSSLSELQSEPEEPSELARDHEEPDEHDAGEEREEDGIEDGAEGEDQDEEDHDQEGDHEAEDDGDDEAGYGNSDEEDDQFATPMAGSRTPTSGDAARGQVAPSTTKKHGPVASWGTPASALAISAPKSPELVPAVQGDEVKREDEEMAEA